MAIRPESIRILPPSAAEGLPGEVAETIYGGGTVACIIRLGSGQTVTVQESAVEGRVRRQGDAVRVSWDTDRVRVFGR